LVSQYFLSEQNTVDRVVDEYAPSINGNSIYMENPPVVVPGVIQEVSNHNNKPNKSNTYNFNQLLIILQALNLDNDAPSVNGNVIYREEPVVLPGVIQEVSNHNNKPNKSNTHNFNQLLIILQAVNLDNDAPSVNGNVIYREEHVVLPGAIQDEDDDVIS